MKRTNNRCFNSNIYLDVKSWEGVRVSINNTGRLELDTLKAIEFLLCSMKCRTYTENKMGIQSSHLDTVAKIS
jgi:hypothetical protein